MLEKTGFAVCSELHPDHITKRVGCCGLQVYVDVNSNIFNIAAAAVYVATAKTDFSPSFP